MAWKLAEAKNKLSEVVRRALEEGPQRIERRGEAVVVISAKEYERLRGERPSLKEFLLSAPDFGALDLERDQSPDRELDW